MEKSVLRDGFCYQIDLVVPNYETNFTEFEQNVFESDKARFYLISGISLDTLLDTIFIDAFIKQGKIYLHSTSRRIECHTCVSLLPNGIMTLSVDQSTFERLPLEVKVKSTHKKHNTHLEIQIDLTNLADLKIDALKKALNSMGPFTFYAHWDPKETRVDVFETLKKYFGETNVKRCLNRVQKETYSVSAGLLETIFPSVSNQDFKKCLNLYGSLLNSVDMYAIFCTFFNFF